MAAKMSSSSV